MNTKYGHAIEDNWEGFNVMSRSAEGFKGDF